MPNKNEPDSSKSRNQLARALARWETEGGTTSSIREEEDEERAVLAKEEEHILECLGAAVIAQWNELPTEVKKALFEHAVSMGDPRHSVQLKEQIARFLHGHKKA
jgi:hypothetical protein